MSTMNERIRAFIAHLDLSVRKFEAIIGVKNGYIRTFGEGSRMEIVENILNTYPQLNREWLLTGEGQMLNTSNKSEAIPTLPQGWLNVPVVPITAQAGYLNGYGDATYIDDLDTMPFPVDRQYRGRYMCFEVRGDSMDDGSSESILHGDFVLAREVQQHLWLDYKLHIKRWSAFVIVTRSEGIIIKQIANHDVDGRTITLHSLNPLFGDYNVPLSDVLEIYNVVQVTRKRM